MDTLMNKSPLVEKEAIFSSCGLLTLKLLPLELIAIQQEIADLREHDPLLKMKKAELIEVARKLRRDETHWRRRCLDKEDLLSRRERATEALAEDRDDLSGLCESNRTQVKALKAELKKEQGDREDAEAELCSLKADYQKDMTEFGELRVELEREREDREKCEAEMEALKAEFVGQTGKTCKMREQKKTIRAVCETLQAEKERDRLMLKELAQKCEQYQEYIYEECGYEEGNTFEDWVKRQEEDESSESD